MPCFPSLAHAEKNSSALQGRWPAGPEGFPIHVSFRKGNKRAVTTLRMANKTAIMAAARETKGHYGRRTANRRGVPARRDSSFLPALTADIQKFAKAETPYHSIPQFVFPDGVTPQECGLFPDFPLPPVLASAQEQLKQKSIQELLPLKCLFLSPRAL